MTAFTLRQTYNIWGGLSRGFPITRAVRGMDVTSTIRELRPGWSPDIRVATVHIGIEKFFWPRSKAADAALRRHIIDARRVLRDRGFTHIAVTGPFLIDIRRRSRLDEVISFRNASLIAKPMTWLYKTRLWLASSLAPRRSDARSKRNRELLGYAEAGFKIYGVFKI
jgi:hypothetical protein